MNPTGSHSPDHACDFSIRPTRSCNPKRRFMSCTAIADSPLTISSSTSEMTSSVLNLLDVYDAFVGPRNLVEIWHLVREESEVVVVVIIVEDIDSSLFGQVCGEMDGQRYAVAPSSVDYDKLHLGRFEIGLQRTHSTRYVIGLLEIY